jgi:hypothetical protein
VFAIAIQFEPSLFSLFRSMDNNKEKCLNYWLLVPIHYKLECLLGKFSRFALPCLNIIDNPEKNLPKNKRSSLLCLSVRDEIKKVL